LLCASARWLLEVGRLGRPELEYRGTVARALVAGARPHRLGGNQESIGCDGRRLTAAEIGIGFFLLLGFDWKMLAGWPINLQFYLIHIWQRGSSPSRATRCLRRCVRQNTSNVKTKKSFM
jgi:hypothetical protein